MRTESQGQVRWRRVRATRDLVCAECRTTFTVIAVGSNRTIYCQPCRAEQLAVQLNAAKILKRAIFEGKVKCAKGQTCVDCGGAAHSLEHRDYLAPLDVVPVCRSCNWKRGPAIWKLDQKTRAEDRALKAVK